MNQRRERGPSQAARGLWKVCRCYNMAFAAGFSVGTGYTAVDRAITSPSWTQERREMDVDGLFRTQIAVKRVQVTALGQDSG